MERDYYNLFGLMAAFFHFLAKVLILGGGERGWEWPFYFSLVRAFEGAGAGDFR